MNNITAMRNTMDAREQLDYVSRPLPVERDILALHGAMTTLTDDVSAKQFYLGQAGKTYGEKCAAYVAEIERLCDGDERAKNTAAMMAAFADDVEAPKIKPVSPEQAEDEAAMKDADNMTTFGDARHYAMRGGSL